MRITRGRRRCGTGRSIDTRTIFRGIFVAQDYLGAARRYYEPTEQGVEKKIKERLDKWRDQIEAARAKTKAPAA